MRALSANFNGIFGEIWLIFGDIEPSSAILRYRGAVLGHLGPSWSRLGPSSGRLGAVLGPSWREEGYDSIYMMKDEGSRAKMCKNLRKTIRFRDREGERP